MRRDCFQRPIAVASLLVLSLVLAPASTRAQTPPRPDGYLANNRAADQRFKADILLVVAHPDDEVMATAYLARAIYEQHKRVAVVYQTAGDGGNNDVGAEQAASMGDIRQIEARRAVGALGISNVWFLGGHDTPSQNVLNSLERCENHGRCLDELVRIVRITRPAVVLTWLPDFVTGENHADHQASGVLATEAFDLAGDPTAFPEQVSPATDPDKNANLTEGLRPWQPQKIYYFSNLTYDFPAGQGPQYSSQEVSPSQHASYGILAAQAFSHHLTQGGQKVLDAMAANTLHGGTDEIAKIVNAPVYLLFGKSLVPGGVTDDVFAGIVAEGVPFQRAPGYAAPSDTAPSIEIGDPWSYYRKFWQAHGIEHLGNLAPLEISVHVNGVLAIPLVVHNPLDTAMDVNVSVQAPDGWKAMPVALLAVPAHGAAYVRVQLAAPADQLPGWQPITVSAQSGGNSLGTVKIRAELSTGWVAPQ